MFTVFEYLLDLVLEFLDLGYLLTFAIFAICEYFSNVSFRGPQSFGKHSCPFQILVIHSIENDFSLSSMSNTFLMLELLSENIQTWENTQFLTALCSRIFQNVKLRLDFVEIW